VSRRWLTRVWARMRAIVRWTRGSLPAVCPVTGRAAERRHALRQSVVRRVVGFQASRWHPLDASSRLWRRWRRWVGPGAWWATQQIGSRPTFVGIACADEALGRAFARELICAGRLWRWLRQRNLLFTVTETRVVVRADLAVRYSSRLSRMATELVLPAARRERDATNTSAQQRQIARERMAQCVAHRLWLSRTIAETDPEAKAEAVALEEAGGKCLVVLGALQQGEAEELARAARLTGHWSPQRHGDTVLSCGRQKVQLAAESAAADPLHALERFVIGFLRQVAISDLHLGVKGRDTFGAHKEPALVRLLDEVIEQRATLILNGDFLELMHESYGAIKRSYPEVFARLARVRRIIYVPGNHDQEMNQFIERALAVATWLVHGEKISNPALFFGHTHEPAAAAADPVHAFTTRLAGASYGNTGAWSSRLRAGRAGDNLIEWLEADASGRVQARAEHVWNRMKPGAVDRCH
jgi:predicted phosphodiesterase